MNNKAASFKSGYLDQLQIRAVLILLVTACILPFAVHLIPPFNGIPMGAFLLPMFYIPFIAVAFYRLHVGLIIAALAPTINFLFTGNPEWQIVTVLSFELIVFSLISFLLLKTQWAIGAAPSAYLMAKLASTLLLIIIPILPAVPIDFFINSIANGAPGIIILFIINWILITRWKSS